MGKTLAALLVSLPLIFGGDLSKAENLTSDREKLIYENHTLFKSPRGKYTIPINWSSEAVVYIKTNEALTTAEEFIDRHSKEGKWTYIIHPSGQMEQFSKKYKNDLVSITISWLPTILEKPKEIFKEIGVPHEEGTFIKKESKLLIDGNEGLINDYIYLKNIEYDNKIIVVNSKEKTYIISITQRHGFKCPENLLDIVKKIKFTE